ncbi:hypothetical protein N7539_006658 [Penicillium diatomitis]|uniref:Uncharacterized protein n=1 Tax=Penicillium diatomitis TaxID=2819901 RepID=A0A9W9X1R5_9EURO|nr:uncharacterized protein N7539_006658 [Penicillium diatomitis]KAJ5480764.1 hypothetical protein N7539_006658 [Penicillium diatomitis]
MAGLVNSPLAVFRRAESAKPLHTRWGDVTISVPTDGSWNQYENPHRAQERQLYGPGFVPDCSPADRSREGSVRHGPTRRTVKNGSVDEYRTGIIAERTSDESNSRRQSLSLGDLRPNRNRLSVRLASHPSQLRGDSLQTPGGESREQKKPEFAYKPIHQDYPSEISETPDHSKHRYRYIPTSGRYLEDIPSPHGSRSQSAMSSGKSSARRDSCIDSIKLYDRERGRVSARHHGHQSYHFREDDRHSVGSSVGGSSDSSGSGPLLTSTMRPRRRTSPFVAAGHRRSTSLRPMTMAMVPDPEDIYE